MSASTPSQSWILDSMNRICSDLQEFTDGRQLEVETLETYELRLEVIYRDLVAIELLDGTTVSALPHIRQALTIIQDMILTSQQRNDSRYQSSVVHDGSVGRPSFQIPRTQLNYLLSMNFTVPQISTILGVSVRTVRRRMSDYGLSVRSLYSTISDSDLEHLISGIQEQYPGCGNQQMQGHLISRGVRVQQHRVREMQRRIDPVGSALRRLRAINRRQYRVDGPGALWHVDGNHKLIRLDDIHMHYKVYPHRRLYRFTCGNTL